MKGRCAYLSEQQCGTACGFIKDMSHQHNVCGSTAHPALAAKAAYQECCAAKQLERLDQEKEAVQGIQQLEHVRLSIQMRLTAMQGASESHTDSLPCVFPDGIYQTAAETAAG